MYVNIFRVLTFQIEGVIGITVDEESVVLVHVNEAFSAKKVCCRCAYTGSRLQEIRLRRE